MLGTIGAGLSIASSVLGFSSRRKARKRQQRAEELERQRSAIANIQNRRKAAAVIRRQESQQQVMALMSGGGLGSSSAQASASSLRSQSIAQDATQRQQEAMGGTVNSTIASANRATGQAETAIAFGKVVDKGIKLAQKP